MTQRLPVLIYLCLWVTLCHAGCSEVDSPTEAVAGQGFSLGCISCKKREEVSARTTVDWDFRPEGEEDFRPIFHYDHPNSNILHEDFSSRLEWLGTQDTDIQIGAIHIHNVTFNDTGTYRCTFQRTLLLAAHEENVVVRKEVALTVVAQANREMTAVIAEILMYVLIVVLQLWLIAVVIYCYKKISEEHDAREARKALKAQERVLESKETCDGVVLE